MLSTAHDKNRAFAVKTSDIRHGTLF